MMMLRTTNFRRVTGAVALTFGFGMAACAPDAAVDSQADAQINGEAALKSPFNTGAQINDLASENDFRTQNMGAKNLGANLGLGGLSSQTISDRLTGRFKSTGTTVGEGPLQPRFECIDLPSFRLWVSYENTGELQSVAPGSPDNFLTGGTSAPSLPGTFYPGDNKYAGYVDVNPGELFFTWELGDATATQSLSFEFPRTCTEKPVVPRVTCVQPFGEDYLLIRYGYNNPNATTIELDGQSNNVFSFGDQGTAGPFVTSFEPGDHPWAFEVITDTSSSATWSLTMFGQTGTADGFIGAAPNCGDIDETCEPSTVSYDLGPAQGFNAFVCGNYTGAQSIKGQVAVGGTAQFSGFSLGTEGFTGDTLIVGTDVQLRSGRVFGSVVAQGTYDITEDVTFVGGEVVTGTRIDFVAACDDLLGRSESLGQIPANSGFTQTAYGALKLTGTRPDLNVFNVGPAAFDRATSFEINVPAESKVLINVRGNVATFRNFAFTYTGASATDVVFNLPDVETLAFIEQIAFKGSILAPGADVTFQNGSFAGTLVANSITGYGALIDEPFVGPLFYNSECPQVTVPADECAITYNVVNAWDTGFQSEVTFTYTGGGLNAWVLEFEFENGEQVINSWNGLASQWSETFEFQGAPWNSTLENGQSASFGFIATGTAAAPTGFRVNGKDCTVTTSFGE
jgi:choice-of-anchor A domain-containing protein